MKGDLSPARIFEAKYPLRIVFRAIKKIKKKNIWIGRKVKRPIIMLSFAPQGIVKQRRNAAMSLSFRDSIDFVERRAIVTQPNPKTMVRVALPLKPISLKSLSVNTVRRGRYPLSSRTPKTK